MESKSDLFKYKAIGLHFGRPGWEIPNDNPREAIAYCAEYLRGSLNYHGAERKGVGYSVQATRDFAAILLHNCIFEELIPPVELVLLITELLDEPVRRTYVGRNKEDDETLHDLIRVHWLLAEQVQQHILGINDVGYQKFEAAARFEASCDPDPKDEQPSVASVASVARESGAGRHTVSRWRKMASYNLRVLALRKEAAGEQTVAVAGPLACPCCLPQFFRDRLGLTPSSNNDDRPEDVTGSGAGHGLV